MRLATTPTPNKKLACFVVYLKITNTFLKNNTCILNKLSKELKTGIEILVGEGDQNSQNIVVIETQEPLGLHRY